MSPSTPFTYFLVCPLLTEIIHHMIGIYTFPKQTTLTIKAFCLVLIFVMSACASSVPLATSEQDAKIKRFEKPQDGLVVYVVQSGGLMTQHRINFQIIINSKIVAIMSGNTYSAHTLPAGSHTLLVSSPENQDLLEFSGKNGDLIFIGVGSHGGWSQMRVSNLRLLSEDEGKKAVLASRLSKTLGAYGG